jgi:hypothetical protein
MIRMLRSRGPLSGIAAMLAGLLIVPVGAAGASPGRIVDAAAFVAPANPVESPAVNPLRVAAAIDALRAGDLGGMQEEALHAVVDAASAWDAASGYGAVEANRAGSNIVVLP